MVLNLKFLEWSKHVFRTVFYMLPLHIQRSMYRSNIMLLGNSDVFRIDFLSAREDA